jgi:hypothetical protein
MSTKFVQTNAIGSKLALPQGIIVCPYINMYIVKTYKDPLSKIKKA